MLTILAAAVAGVAVVNALAWFHARSLTRFVPEGLLRTPVERVPAAKRLRLLCLGVRLARPANAVTPASFGMPFRSFTVRPPGGGRIACWDVPRRGARATAALFHGYASARDGMLPQAAVLRRLGCRVVLSDFRGSGASSGSVTTIGWREADDVAAVARWLSPPDGRGLILVGASMGAAAVLRAVAHLGVRPRALILEAPFDSLLNAVRNRFQILGAPSFPFAELLVFWGGVQLGFNALALRPARWAEAVQCPALVIARGADRRATPADCRRVWKALGGPKRFAVLRVADHEDVSPRTMRRWARAVRPFLQSVPA